MKFFILNSLCISGKLNLFSLIYTLFDTTILPNLKHFLENVLNPSNGVKFHATFPVCYTYIGEFDKIKHIKTCQICRSKFDISNTRATQIFLTADLLKIHEDHYEYVVKNRVSTENVIEDVYDGNRQFQRSLSESDRQSYVSAVLNTDGAPIFKTLKTSIWPIFLKINELPRQEWMKKLVTLVHGLTNINRKF